MGTIEYRLVTVRPGSDGKHRKVYGKRDYSHARQSLEDWVRDMKRYTDNGLVAWPAHIESREVTDWEPVTFDTEGVPV